MANLDPTQQWILDNKKVCQCNGIKRKTVVDAINAGADTLEKVSKATGTGTGGCHGNRCTPVITELLEELSSKKQR